jgi:hypothetical protein
MDLSKTIAELHEEKEKLERVIASLEELASAMADRRQHPLRTNRAGRKFMGAEEREQVSARMKQYWAQRRTRQASSGRVQ